MSDTKAMLRATTLVFHGLAAVALLLLFLSTRGMTAIIVVSGTLIGCTSVPARQGRPIALYCGFGLLMGDVFWTLVSFVNQREFLGLVPALLLAVGVAWLLNDPCWSAALFAAVTILLSAALSIWQLQLTRNFISVDDEHVRRSAITSLVALGVGSVYLCLGVAECLLPKSRKTKRPRHVSRPTLEERQ